MSHPLGKQWWSSKQPQVPAAPLFFARCAKAVTSLMWNVASAVNITQKMLCISTARSVQGNSTLSVWMAGLVTSQYNVTISLASRIHCLLICSLFHLAGRETAMGPWQDIAKVDSRPFLFMHEVIFISASDQKSAVWGISQINKIQTASQPDPWKRKARNNVEK